MIDANASSTVPNACLTSRAEREAAESGDVSPESAASRPELPPHAARGRWHLSRLPRHLSRLPRHLSRLRWHLSRRVVPHRPMWETTPADGAYPSSRWEVPNLAEDGSHAPVATSRPPMEAPKRAGTVEIRIRRASHRPRDGGTPRAWCGQAREGGYPTSRRQRTTLRLVGPSRRRTWTSSRGKREWRRPGDPVGRAALPSSPIVGSFSPVGGTFLTSGPLYMCGFITRSNAVCRADDGRW